jgi:hypothetical protein
MLPKVREFQEFLGMMAIITMTTLIILTMAGCGCDRVILSRANNELVYNSRVGILPIKLEGNNV